MLLRLAVLVLSTTLLTGCIGIYNNSASFFNEPEPGMSETDMLRTYGTPAFAGEVQDQTVYTYKVRDNKYIVLVGIYEGHDLVVTCEDGKVTQVSKVKRPQTLTILQPVPWAEGLE